MKRFSLLICMAVAWGATSPAFSVSSPELTLLLVPREDALVRVAMDVAKRYPTLVVSYKVLPGGAVSLHGWSGSEWVNVTSESFQSGTFFQKSPDSALLIEAEGGQAPDSLLPSPEWCPEVYRITTTELRPLLHLIGRRYDFKYTDWKWFSSNYKMPLNTINPEGLNMEWYHRRLGEHLSKETALGSSDLRNLFVVRSPQLSADAETVVIPEEPLELSESNQVENAVTAGDNPLTNTAPKAVILEAGAAEEADASELQSTNDTAVAAAEVGGGSEEPE